MRESDLHQDSSFKMAEEEENTALQTASGSSGSGSALAIHDTSDKSNDAEMPCNAQAPQATDVESRDHCGCCGVYPARCQTLATTRTYLICICCLVFVQSMVVSGYSSAILTTIEARYSLRSRELGYIVSSYDVTALISGLIVSYSGDRHNRALWLARGALLISLGSLCFSSPQFFGGIYEPSSSRPSNTPSLCHTEVSHPTCDRGTRSRWALPVFMLSFMVIGIGASPIYTLGPTYLYDNCPRTKYPVYSSVMYSMGALGPATGFLLGSCFLQFWIDPFKSSGQGVPNSEWLGAWWAGFLLCAALALLVSAPLHFFPKQLPAVKCEPQTEEEPVFAGFGNQLKEFPRILWRLLRSPVWLSISLTYVSEQVIGTGFNRFIVKYLEVSYGVPASKASILTGCVLIPAAVCGIVSGGVAMRRLALSIHGIIKFLLILNVIPTVLLFGMLFLYCDGVPIVGVPGISRSDHISFPSPCNTQCHCNSMEYAPVCGDDNVTYFSACLAGCQSRDEHTGQQVYRNCSCIISDVDAADGMAQLGKCPVECNLLPWFLVLLFLCVFATSMGQTPVLLVTLRSVPTDRRSFALGMQNFLIQVFAYFPTPMVMGIIVDSQCLIWTRLCDGEGFCKEYDKLAYYFIGCCLGVKCLTFIFLGLSWLATRRLSEKDGTPGDVAGDLELEDIKETHA